MDKLREQAIRLRDARRAGEHCVGGFQRSTRSASSRTYSDEIEALTVIVATGARANWLGVPNEERLAQTGGGVSACAVCDGALPAFRDKVLAVVGGGDSAMEESALPHEVRERGSASIHRRDELRASKIMADRVLQHPKIKPVWNSRVAEVLGYDAITGIRLENTETGEMSNMPTSAVCSSRSATRLTRRSSSGQLELTPHGYIKTPNAWRTATSVDGVFAAGDVMD